MTRPRLIVVIAAALACLCQAPALGQIGQSGSGGRPGTPPAPGAPGNRPDPVGTGAISGLITDATTHRPLAGALVYLGIQGHGPVNQRSRQITDSKGRFVFVDLPASDVFFLNVSKAGYNDGHYGDTGPVSAGVAAGLVKLVDGQWFRDANIPMWRPGAIGGTVVDEAGEPVVGAIVRVLARIYVAGASHLAAGAMTHTDDRGHYRLSGLSPGTYIVNVPSVQSSVPIATSADAIEGISSQPGARQPSSESPRRNNGAIDAGGGQLLIIGNYPTAPASSTQRLAYPIVFSPGVSSVAEAATIDLPNGGSRENVDIALRPVTTARVSGQINGPVEAARGLVLRLVPGGLEDLGDGSEAATAMTGPNGEFTFVDVPAGDYTLVASRSQLEYSYGPSRTFDMPATPGAVPGPGTILSGIQSGPPGSRVLGNHSAGDQNYWARLPVSVGNGDVTGLSVPLRRAITMRGRVAFEGDGVPPNQTAIMVEPADGSASLGIQQSTTRPTVDGDDQFTINGLGPGEYVLRVLGLTPKQTVKSVTVGGVDFTARRLDATSAQDLNDVVITYTDRIATITGAVQGDPSGASLRMMSVIAFPAAREQWTRYGLSPLRFKTVPVSNAATYKIENLPAGQYLLIAVDAADARRWQDPAFLENASRVAARVTVGWGETQTQDLRVSVIK